MMHGGKSLAGLASPRLKHGRSMGVLPDRMLGRFQESLEDPDLLSLRSEIALVDARLEDLIKRVDTGEAGEIWFEARDAYNEYVTAQRAKDVPAMATALNNLGKALNRGTADYAAWHEVRLMLEHRRKLVESERKRLVEMHQVITNERALILMAGIADVIKSHVNDRNILNSIIQDIRTLAAGSSGGAAGAAGQG